MHSLPSDEEVEKAIEKVLQQQKEVHSQKLLHSLVLKELREANQYYKISEERVRKLAANTGVRIFVEKRKAEKESRRCYVCGGELEVVRGRDLYGSASAVAKRCAKCGFEIERGKLGPSRYVFYRRG